MAYKRGIYVDEQATSLLAPITGSAGLQIIFGTAPINLVADPQAAVNTLVLCHSMAEAQKALGYSEDFKQYTLCQSMDACFKIKNIAPVIFVNVLDPHNEAHVEDVPGTDMPVNNRQAQIRASGSPVMGVLSDTVIVKPAGGEGSAYEADVDYIVSYDAAGTCNVTVLGSGSVAQATSLNIAYTKLKPAGVTDADIIGGYNAATGAETGLELIRQVYPKLGLTSGLILAPGWSHLPIVAAAMQGKCERINGCFNCECLLDIDCSATGARVYADVKIHKEALGANSQHAAVYWPMGKVGDKKYYMSALMGALIAYTDAANQDVPNLSPSNKALGITGLCLEDGTEVVLDQEQANTVCGFGVCTALNHNGFKAWGNNTAAYPATTDPKDRWFAVRRFFSWWGNSFILTYFQKVDDPSNYRLIDSIVDSENIRGNSFVARGFCAQAKITFRQEENPITDILGGNIKFHTQLAPYTPAEVIDLIMEFNPLAIQAEITGSEV